MQAQNFRFTRANLRRSIRSSYGQLASDPSQEVHYETGRDYALRLGYSDQTIDQYGAKSIDAFAGVGNPFTIAQIMSGQVVVDIGSGAGMDSCIASGLVGPIGNVFGIEMTDEMLMQARTQVAMTRLKNVTFTKAYAEKIPLPDQTADVVISNGVINLCPDKEAVFREVIRVLRPGGRIQIADVVVQVPIPPDTREQPRLWTECVAGAITEKQYIDVLERTGFKNIRIDNYIDVFANAPIAACAARFGAKGAHIYAEK